MARAGLSTEAVVDAALAVLDEGGPEALTLAAVAARTGVATPSLYAHVRNLAALRGLVAQRVLIEMTARLGAAVMGRSRDAAVAALFRVWREYVRVHPHRYAALPAQPLGDPGLVTAAAGLMEVVLAVLAGYGLTGADAIHAARRLRATAHGFVTLEAAGGFGLPEDLDTSFDQLIEMVVASLRAASPVR